MASSRFLPLLALSALILLSSAAQADDGTVIALTLPVSGETVIVLPPGNVAWTARAFQGRDLIESTAGPEVALRLLREEKGSCAEEGIGGVQLAGQPKLVESPSYLPDKFYPTAVESRGSAELAAVCADLPQGTLVAMMMARAPFTSAEVSPRLRGLLESLAITFGAERRAAPASRTITLAVSGVSLELPERWRGSSKAPGGERPYDHLERLDPTQKLLEIRVAEQPQVTCAAWAGGRGAQLAGVWAERPDYLPSGWYPKVRVLPPSKVASSVFCADVGGGSLVAMATIIAGTFDAASFGDGREVMATLAREVGASTSDPPPTAVIAQPVPTPTPTPTPAPSPTPSPPSEDDDDDWDLDDDLFRTPVMSADLRVAHAAPEGFDPILAVTLHIAGGLFVADEHDDIAFGLEGDYGLSGGVTTDGNIPFDVHLGLGPGLRLGPVTISPVVGLGVDTAGAGGDYDMGAAFYWYPGGRLRLAFGDFGLSGYAARTFRGSIGADRAGDVPNLTRVESRLWFRIDDVVPYLGFHWTDVTRYRVRAQFIGGMLGVGIPLE
ncbi:MAG: hypothetical protein R3B72_03330 [Polyangiaceae bacterium]